MNTWNTWTTMTTEEKLSLAFHLAVARGFPVDAEFGHVWPSIDKGYGLTTGIIYRPDSEDAKETLSIAEERAVLEKSLNEAIPLLM